MPSTSFAADSSYQDSIPCSGDSLCHPLTIYKGFLVCAGINDAFFLPSPGEKPVSTWAILPPIATDISEQTSPDSISSPPCQNLQAYSNQLLLERLRTELSPEGIAKLLESQASQDQNQLKPPIRASGSKKRKNFKPYKSPSPDDPNFSGLQIKMNYKLKGGKLDFCSAHKFW